jgi:hypothetical protein
MCRSASPSGPVQTPVAGARQSGAQHRCPREHVRARRAERFLAPVAGVARSLAPWRERQYRPGMEILFISSSGASDPTRASIPWHLAVNGSIEADQSARILLAGDATDVLIRATRDGLEGVGVPPLHELVAKATERSVPIHV